MEDESPASSQNEHHILKIGKMSDPCDLGSEIANFYRGRSVFVTGGTGFMGKVLLQKLLRSCPGISNIYCLMRPKKGNDVKTRLQELLDTSVSEHKKDGEGIVWSGDENLKIPSIEIFDTLRKENPECFSKVIPITGDISRPNLGICAADYQMLCESVSVVFHSAATVKFDEPLKFSVSLNLIGTKSLVQLCHSMEKLEAVVHVSTAYCNCDRKEVNESLYPAPADPETIINYAECLDEETLNCITPRIIKTRPNTYTFTKALAEHVFVTQGKGLPAAIVRPSIVTAAWKEPIPGWIDNLNGPTGLLAGAGKGILRSLLCYKDLVADLIPVDIAINLLITVAWHTAVTRPNNITIYNCTSGKLNPIHWVEIQTYGQDAITRVPFNDVVWYPGGSFKRSRFVNNVCVSLFQVLPAYILDTASRLTGKKPVMVRIQKKFSKAITALEYFTTHEWQFESNNITKLYNKLGERDRELFDFNVKQVNWRKYMDNYVLGIRLYILKEDLSSLQSAKRHLRKMYFLHKATQILMFILMWRFVLMRNDKARQLWFSLWTTSLRLLRLVPFISS